MFLNTSFSTDFTIHKLSSLLYSSQIYFFKYGLKSFFFPFVTNWKELTYNKRKWHSNMNPQSVKCLTHSQQLPHVPREAGALIRGCFATVLVVKGRLLVLFLPVSYAMLMRPNKAETAVHGCHYLGDMAVLMPEHGLVLERATFFYCSERVTFVVDCVKCVSIPIIKTGWPTLYG